MRGPAVARRRAWLPLGFAACLCKLTASLAPEAEAAAEVAGATYRVQALSRTLVRIELHGPQGFENRSTFLARGRDWQGVPIRHHLEASGGGASFATDSYSVHLGAPKDPSKAHACAIKLLSSGGAMLWESGDFGKEPVGLSVPPPAEVPGSYVLAILDAPRFVPPAVGATPQLGPIPPQLRNTSGFDFGNHAPDIYLFMAAAGYSAMRGEFLQLTGSIPMLPAWAFGFWFTWYHPYNQSEKTKEIQRFLDDDLGIAVVSLDRNWRQGAANTTVVLPDEGEYFVNKDLFPDIDGFFTWVHSKGLRIFFNDHPKYLDSGPSGAGSGAPEDALAPAEVQFRWDGLTSLMRRGLDFWWYDCHWRWFPPALKVPGAGSVDYITWGQAVFQDITARYMRENRPPSDSSPFSLGCAESHHPASHRYPVWWTGDNFDTNLMGSVADMIRGGYEGFKPYVHPDCGGHHGHNEPEVYVRWIQFCSLGTIMRVHSDPWNDRRPWMYGEEVESLFRKFVKLRLRLLPELHSAAMRASQSGEPLVGRLDFEWPEVPEATRMDQYLLASVLLVAPIDPFPGGKPGRKSDFNRSRTVWIPPGEWTNAFSGATLRGPQQITRTNVSLEELPLYHRRGALVVVARDSRSMSEVDWTSLVVNCWPASASAGTSTMRREVHLEALRGLAILSMGDSDLPAHEHSDELGASDGGCLGGPPGSRRAVRVAIAMRAFHGTGELGSAPPAWLLRVHLLAGERVVCVQAGGEVLPFQSLEPVSAGLAVPLGGAGQRPGRLAGFTVEIELPASARHSVDLTIALDMPLDGIVI